MRVAAGAAVARAPQRFWQSKMEASQWKSQYALGPVLLFLFFPKWEIFAALRAPQNRLEIFPKVIRFLNVLGFFRNLDSYKVSAQNITNKMRMEFLGNAHRGKINGKYAGKRCVLR